MKWEIREQRLADGSIVYDVVGIGEVGHAIIIHARDKRTANSLCLALVGDAEDVEIVG